MKKEINLLLFIIILMIFFLFISYFNLEITGNAALNETINATKPGISIFYPKETMNVSSANVTVFGTATSSGVLYTKLNNQEYKLELLNSLEWSKIFTLTPGNNTVYVYLCNNVCSNVKSVGIYYIAPIINQTNQTQLNFNNSSLNLNTSIISFNATLNEFNETINNTSKTIKIENQTIIEKENKNPNIFLIFLIVIVILTILFFVFKKIYDKKHLI